MRIKKVKMSPVLALQWLQGIDKPYATNLPYDVRLVSMYVEPSDFYDLHIHCQQVIVFTVESESFDDLKDGDKIPEFVCEVTTKEAINAGT